MQTDLTKYPEQILTHRKPTLMLGDLHGNALKLMNFLVTFGVVGMNSKQYGYFVEMYNSLAQQVEDNHVIITAIKRLLSPSKVRVNPAHLVLIGDEFADRGKNDFLTLKILELLDSAKDMKLSILASNHSFEYMRATQRKTKSLEYMQAEEVRKKTSSQKVSTPRFFLGERGLEKGIPDLLGVNFLKHDHSPSLYGLLSLVHEVPEIEEDIHQFNENIYLKVLKLIDYCEVDGYLHILSHAPIDSKLIVLVAHVLGVDGFQDSITPSNIMDKVSLLIKSEQSLKQTLDKINERFVEKVRDGSIYEWMSESQVKEFYGFCADDAWQTNPVAAVMWNRYLNYREDPIFSTLPRVDYVHGHTGEWDEAKRESIRNIASRIHNLDDGNNLGKSPEHSKGRLRFLSGKTGWVKKLETGQLQRIPYLNDDIDSAGPSTSPSTSPLAGNL